MPNKEVEKKAKDLHSDLLDNISRDLRQKDVKKFKDRLRNEEYGGFRAREIEEMEDIEAIFDAQQKRKVFSVGKYGKLKEQLEKVKCTELVDEVRKFEQEMRSIGYPVMSRGESMDAAPSGSYPPPLTPTSPDYNPNITGFNLPPGRKEPDVCYTAGRGYVLYISNFYRLPDNTGHPRPGVTVDYNNINSFFSEGYEVEFHPDIRTPTKLWQLIDEVKEKVEHCYSSFFLIVSSHGKGIALKDDAGKNILDDKQKPIVISEGIQLVQPDAYVRVDEIVSKFAKFMLGKPKVLIFQACRSLSDKADDSSVVSFYDSQQQDCSITIPGNADMVVIHDTSKGCKGWRNEDHGAWLFYCMFFQLKTYYTREHLLDVLTRVNHMIACRDARAENGKVVGKQMPCFTSTFTRFFYLK